MDYYANVQKHVQNVLKNVFKTCSKHVQKCVQNVFKNVLKNEFKNVWKIQKKQTFFLFIICLISDTKWTFLKIENKKIWF